MKHVVTGVIVFIIGFILVALWGNGSDAFAILYLASVVGGATSVIVEELRNR